MPERIIRPGILTSDPVCSLSWAAEVFYRRLMSVVDDYGRYDGRLLILRTALYPLQIDKVSDSDIGKWRLETAKAGLVRIYSHDGKEYVELLKFRQRMRAEKSKFPAPEDGLPSSACESQQPRAPATEAYSISETKSSASSGSTRPPLDECLAWAERQEGNVQGLIFTVELVEHWYDYRKSAGWTMGDAEKPIRDWKSDLNNWCRNEKNRGQQRGQSSLKPPAKPLTLR